MARRITTTSLTCACLAFLCGIIAAQASALDQVEGPPISVGTHPVAMAITPDGTRAYVADEVDDSVHVVDLHSRQVVGQPIDVGDGPLSIAVSPDGERVYVANYESADLSVIDTETGQVIGQPIPVGGSPCSVVVTPDGSRAYVASDTTNSVVAIDLETEQVEDSIPLPAGPFELAVTPDSSEVYVAMFNDDVAVIDTASNEVDGTPIDLGGASAGPIVVNPQGTTAYLLSPDLSREIIPIDTGTRVPGAPISTGPSANPNAHAGAIAITPDGKRLYVTFGENDSVVAIDAEEEEVIGPPLAVGDFPQEVAIAPSSRYAYVINGNDRTISVVSIAADNRPTAAAVSCTPATVTVGEAITCTATVTDAGAPSAPPRGGVIFTSSAAGGFNLGGCLLVAVGGSSSASSCTLQFVPGEAGSGTHAISIAYSGDAEHQASEGQASVTVQPLPHPTSTSVSCAPVSLLVGSAVNCTAVVTDTAPGANAPSGQVNFASNGPGGFSNGACVPAGPDRISCKVSYSANGLGAGVHAITAAFTPSSRHLASQGTAQLQVAAAPDTVIKKKPKKRTPKRIATFTFVSDQAGSTFQCKLDKQAFKPCKSPLKIKKLKKGKHTLLVRAVNAGGVTDPTPARYSWKVGKAKRR